MVDKAKTLKTGEWLPGPRSNPGQELDNLAAFNPMLPWLQPLPWLRIEYLMIEIQLDSDDARIRGERGRLQDGMLISEQLEASLPMEMYLQAAEQMQRQVQATMQAFMLPWTSMMFPFWKKD